MEELKLDYLKELGGGDNDFIIEMLQTYMDETGKDMLALQVSLEEKNLKRIGFLAHRCKAAFRILGLEKMFQEANDLEQNVKAENAVASTFEKPVNILIDGIKNSLVQAENCIERLSN
jgi:HPt (histidine-containing phosphotransfer) domain-containing protein